MGRSRLDPERRVIKTSVSLTMEDVLYLKKITRERVAAQAISGEFGHWPTISSVVRELIREHREKS